MAKKITCELLKKGDYLTFNIEALETLERVTDVSLFAAVSGSYFERVSYLFNGLAVGLMDCYKGATFEELRARVIEAYEKQANPELYGQLVGVLTLAVHGSGLFGAFDGDEDEQTEGK